MPARETIAAFLSTQMDFIFFLCGLAFVLFGAVCLAVARVRKHGSPWISLALFGLVHGIGEWLDLSALVVGDNISFTAVRIAVMTASFLCLMEFTRQKAIAAGLKPPGLPLYFGLMVFVAAAGSIGGASMAAAIGRHAIGLLAAIGASWIFARRASGFSGSTRRLVLLASAGFALYGLTAALALFPAPLRPADGISQSWFVQATGLPIELVQGALACLLTLSVWSFWRRLAIAEVASEQYTAHLRHQLVWTLAVLATVLTIGWTLTQFLGGIYQRNVEDWSQGDITLLLNRFAGERASSDGMVSALAGTPSLPALNSGSIQDGKRARSFLALGVEASGAAFGAILDVSGAVAASSNDFYTREARQWPTAPWFRQSLAGQVSSQFTFDPKSRTVYYYASAPIRRDDGSIAGVAFLEKPLDQFGADLGYFVRPYYLVNPEGVVVQTNRQQDMLRTLWSLPDDARSSLRQRLGALNDRPMVERELRDATWLAFDGQRSFVRRSYLRNSQWSVVLVIPGVSAFASRFLGIVITLLGTIMALIYFYGWEHGIRDRIQLNKRLALQELAQDLRFRATTDPLTGLYNRAEFDEALASETGRSGRYKSPLALIMFDIDHFKQVNDAFGHQVGDEVLVQLSQTVSGNVRHTDVLARWGGEEFVILAPGLDGAAAFQAAEKIRRLISQTAFPTTGRVTCSFGVAEHVKGDTAETLVARADGALYRAKMMGRNRVELAPTPVASKISSVA
jgi:diguanylate cyclase (GGDEF)-like protein